MSIFFTAQAANLLFSHLFFLISYPSFEISQFFALLKQKLFLHLPFGHLFNIFHNINVTWGERMSLLILLAALFRNSGFLYTLWNSGLSFSFKGRSHSSCSSPSPPSLLSPLCAMVLQSRSPHPWRPRSVIFYYLCISEAPVSCIRNSQAPTQQLTCSRFPGLKLLEAMA